MFTILYLPYQKSSFEDNKREVKYILYQSRDQNLNCVSMCDWLVWIEGRWFSTRPLSSVN